MNVKIAVMPFPQNTPTPPASGIDETWKHYRTAGSKRECEELLIQHYLHLVKTVIGRLAMSLPSHVDQEDLHSAGLLGLLNAIRNFDQDRGTAFEPYARLRIRGAALDELRRMDWTPRSVHAKARKVQSVMEALESTLQRFPTEQEMAAALQLSLPAYQELLDEIRPATFICLDACAMPHENDSASEHELIAGSTGDETRENVSNRELSEVIGRRLRQLPEMQRKVLALYYFEDLRLREIAEVFNLSESRICQIHTQAILSIRSYLEHYEATRTDSGNHRLAA